MNAKKLCQGWPEEVKWAHIGPFSDVSEPFSAVFQPIFIRKSTFLDFFQIYISKFRAFLSEEKFWKRVTQLGSPCWPEALLSAIKRQWRLFQPKMYQISHHMGLVKINADFDVSIQISQWAVRRLTFDKLSSDFLDFCPKVFEIFHVSLAIFDGLLVFWRLFLAFIRLFLTFFFC